MGLSGQTYTEGEVELNFSKSTFSFEGLSKNNFSLTPGTLYSLSYPVHLNYSSYSAG